MAAGYRAVGKPFGGWQHRPDKHPWRKQAMRLANKVAIITGAASGMGAATARRFGKEGASVVIADMLADEGRAVAGDIDANECNG
jgi:NADPH-dependent glutamate synthase beta subunit-like oxidoreductase